MTDTPATPPEPTSGQLSVGKEVFNFKGPQPEPKKKGRPTLFTRELADRICRVLVTGRTLRQACRLNSDFPDESTVREWAYENTGRTDGDPANGVDPYSGFFPQYTRAREIGYLCMADDQVDIADDGSNDWMIAENESGQITVKVNHEHIKRSVLRVDTRKWLLSKALPKIYGDKLDLNVTGGKEALPNASTDMSVEDARDLYNAIRQKKGK